MDDILHRLLEAEAQAEAQVEDAKAVQERLLAEALQQARAADERFAADLPGIRAALLDKATQRAAGATAELRRRYEDYNLRLRQQAEVREAEALDAALALLAGGNHRAGV
jgi:vacuolar-type H+-ATPase subunit H